MIKIVAILSLIVTGIIMALAGFETPVGKVAFSNVWHHFELFPNGLVILLMPFKWSCLHLSAWNLLA